MYTLDHLIWSQSQFIVLSKQNHDPTGWLFDTGYTQRAFHCSSFEVNDGHFYSKPNYRKVHMEIQL